MLHTFIENEEEICITEIILTEILQGIKDDITYETTKKLSTQFPIIKPKGKKHISLLKSTENVKERKYHQKNY